MAWRRAESWPSFSRMAATCRTKPRCSALWTDSLAWSQSVLTALSTRARWTRTSL